jgi:hypothetical protein
MLDEIFGVLLDHVIASDSALLVQSAVRHYTHWAEKKKNPNHVFMKLHFKYTLQRNPLVLGAAHIIRTLLSEFRLSVTNTGIDYLLKDLNYDKKT